MSSKPKKTEKRKLPEVPVEEGPKRPAGRVPEAMVSSRNGTEMVTRQGRGFSLGELSGAGLARRMASEWGVRVDVRRRSVLDGNVSALRRWKVHPAPQRKPEGGVKKVEEGLVKVEKAAKKRAAKAEKAVKAKVEKPKAKQKKKSES